MSNSLKSITDWCWYNIFSSFLNAGILITKCCIFLVLSKFYVAAINLALLVVPVLKSYVVNCVNAVINLGWKEVWSDICEFFQVEYYLLFVSLDLHVDVRTHHQCTTKKVCPFYVLMNMVSLRIFFLGYGMYR